MNDIPPELKSAAPDWYTPDLDAGTDRGYYANLTVRPPSLRLEACSRKESPGPCTVLVDGTPVALTPDTVTLAQEGRATVTLGWRIQGGKMQLVHEGRKISFVPGKRSQLLKLLGLKGSGD